MKGEDVRSETREGHRTIPLKLSVVSLPRPTLFVGAMPLCSPKDTRREFLSLLRLPESGDFCLYRRSLFL